MTIKQTFIGPQIKEPTMLSKTLLTIPLLLTLASPALADADKALLAKCDLNKNGEIDRPATYGISKKDLNQEQREIIQKENSCKVNEESARLDAELAKGKEDLARINYENNQLIEILAMLDAGQAKAYLKDEIQKAETNLAKAKENGDQRRANSIEYRLNQLRARQQKLK
ncbi:MAG: hypothetical protein C0445_16440 [Polaromonas sp.]|nr:hypothetical protein [Polaromonas sp.]